MSKSSRTLRVRQGGAVLDRRGVLHYGGSVVPEGALSEADIKAHLASGYIEESNEGPLPDVPVANPPGVDISTPVPGLQTGTDKSLDASKAVVTDKGPNLGPVPESKPAPNSDALSVTSGEGGVTMTSTPQAPPPNNGTGAAISKWVLDPATLTGKKVEDLNVMILERDPTVKPFETVEEAVAFLSQDFQPTK